MKKYNVIELIEEIKERNKNNKIDVSSFCDYNGNDYLDDIINEIADNYVDIYYNDLFDWAKDNFSYINDAISEYGLSDNTDIVNQIQMGQYYENNEEIYNSEDDMLSIYIYDILDKHNIDELTEEQNDIIYDLVKDMKDDNKLYDEDYIISEVMNNEEE